MADALDCTNALLPCNCTPSQTCVQIGRSSTECARNTCVDRPGSGGAGDGGGKSNIGALAGQAVGGVTGGLLILFAIYWFWWRRRGANGVKGNNAASSPTSMKKSPNPMKEFKMGRQSTHGGGDEKDLTSPPGPGEEDAQPVKRQSLRFDKNNNPLSNRRSLSNTHNALPDNPFGDHHSSNDGSSNTGRDVRQSQATISEFSFRSSHSTNIIPIAYIPAHASQNGVVPKGSVDPSSSTTDSSNRRHTISARDSSVTGYTSSGGAVGARGSRASVPFSLRSSANETSLFGSSGLNLNHDGTTFSGLFDSRFSSAGTTTGTVAGGDSRAANSSTSPGANGMEIIAGPAPGSTSPSMNTPTMTRGGKPIRPPRAPGLDLKLPTPEPKSPSALSPPISPGYPWNSASSSNGGSTPKKGLGIPSSATAGHFSSGPRETLLSADGLQPGNARTSAYSTFSQATGSTGSHMSYILDPPQIVTPVSAGRVEVQQLSRGVAKTVKLGNNPAVPAIPSQYASLNASTAVSRSNTITSSHRQRIGSPLADNPFADDAAVDEVRISIPSPSQGNTPTIPSTPTFGGSNTAAGRRDSDLSIFTSASGQLGAAGQASRTSLASSFGGGHSLPLALSSSVNGNYAPSAISARPSHDSQQLSEHETILEPPRRPFAPASNTDSGMFGNGDSRHNSTALSTRSGYASVLDGIPFNLSLSPEARHSQASSNGGNGLLRDSTASSQGRPLLPPSQSTQSGLSSSLNIRDSNASFNSQISDSTATSNDKRDTSYSLASEWNGAFAGMPIVMGGGTTGPGGEAVPALPDIYKNNGSAAAGGNGNEQKDDENDARYSSDSLAMAAAVARSFGRD